MNNSLTIKHIPIIRKIQKIPDVADTSQSIILNTLPIMVTIPKKVIIKKIQKIPDVEEKNHQNLVTNETNSKSDNDLSNEIRKLTRAEKNKVATKIWRDKNKERIKAYSMCRKNEIDWEEYKTENGFGDKPLQPSNNRIDHKFDNGIELKWCNHCKDFLSLEKFSKAPKAWDGLRSFCKGYDKEYRSATKKPYTLVKCDMCDKEVESQYLLEHKTKVHCETPYSFQCDTCLIKFKNEFTYKRHLKTNTHAILVKTIELENKRTIEQITINNIVNDVNIIKDPIIDVDKEELPIDEESNNLNQYKCDQCEFTTNKNRNLLTHVRRVHAEPEHICTYILPNNQVCNKSFRRADRLNRHIESVHERLTTKCEYCKKDIVKRDITRHTTGCVKNMALKIYPGSSVWEKMVFKFCTENNIKFEPQKKYMDLKDKSYLPYDFLLEGKLLVETHGKQHYEKTNYAGADEKFIETLKHDQMKKEYAEKHNIELMIIDTRANNTYEKIATIIASGLGISKPIISEFSLFVQDETDGK